MSNINGQEHKTMTIPAISRAASTMLTKMLGIDPGEIFTHIMEATGQMVAFCKHFDLRMVAVANEVKSLRGEIQELKGILEDVRRNSEQHPGSTDNCDSQFGFTADS